MARLLVVVVATLAAACASTSAVSSESVESLIPAAIWPDDPSLVSSVACPPEIERVAGLTVQCTVSFAGEDTAVDVSQVDEDGGIAVAFDLPVIRGDALAHDVAERLSADLDLEVIATCDEPYAAQIARPGTRFTCVATDPLERDLVFVAELLSAGGEFTLELQ